MVVCSRSSYGTYIHVCGARCAAIDVAVVCAAFSNPVGVVLTYLLLHIASMHDVFIISR